MTTIKPADLTKEKSLFDLYLLSYKFPTSRFNLGIAIFAFVATAIYCYFTGNNFPALVKFYKDTIDIGLSFSTAILGFLVAGFTIFATVSNPDVFVKMASTEYENTGESYLKYNLTQFALVFCHYASYVFICILIKIFASDGTLVRGLTQLAINFDLASAGSLSTFSRYLLIAVAIFLCTWTVYLVMLLKSFIFNTFTAVTTMVRWEMQAQSKNKH